MTAHPNTSLKKQILSSKKLILLLLLFASALSYGKSSIPGQVERAMLKHLHGPKYTAKDLKGKWILYETWSMW